MKRVSFIFILLLISISSTSQDFDENLLQINSIQNEGIRRINSISEDSFGHIWLATNKGLYTFNGNTLSKFNRLKPLLQNTYYTYLVVDSKNRVWAGTYAQGLICINLNNNKVIQYKHKLNDSSSLADNRIKLIFEDENNVIWIGTHTSGLNKLIDNSQKFEHYLPSQNLPGRIKRNIDEFTSFKKDPLYKNIYWIGSLNGLLKFNVINFTFELFDCNRSTIQQKKTFTGYENESRNISFTNDGLLLGTWGGGICKVDTVKKTFDSYKFESTDLISHLRNNVVFSTVNKQNKFLVTIGKKGTLEYIHKDKKLKKISEKLLRKHFIDSEGKEWFVFGKNQLFVKPKQSQIFQPILYNKGMESFYFNKDSILFSKYQKQKIEIFDLLSNKTRTIYYTPANDIGLNWIGKIYKTHNDELILQESKDLYILKNGAIFLYFNKDSLESKINTSDGIILSSIVDKDNEIWMGFKKYGILRIHQDKKHHEFYNVKDGMIHSGVISTLFEDNQHRIWFGSEKGLGFIDKKDNKVYNITDSVKSFIYINSFSQSADSTIWVGESNSILKIKVRNNNTYRLESIIPPQIIGQNIEIHDIDSLGNLWGASSQGIFFFNIINNSFKFWGATYGFNRVNKLKLFGSDSMFVATKSTILKGKTIDLFSKEETANLEYTYLKLFNKDFNYNDKPFSQVTELNLEYKQSFITVGFGLLEVINPENLNFEFKLEGQNEDWIPLGKRNYVEFSHLNPGDYKLQIRQVNVGHKPIYSKVLNINVKAPFWQTWWFRIIILALLLLSIFTYISKKNRKIKKEFKKKVAFQKQLANVEMMALKSQMNPHFIFNCLNTIKLFVKEDKKEKASRYIGDFSKLLRMALNNSRVNLILLSDELEYVRLYIEMEKMRFEQKINYKISNPNDLDLKQFKVPPMLIQPFVENAIKHGILPLKTKGKITIDVKKEANHIIYTILDNGIGRKASMEKNKGNRLTKSLGINITNDRLNLIKTLYGMEASIDIIDLENGGIAQGTKVIIHIPIILKIEKQNVNK